MGRRKIKKAEWKIGDPRIETQPDGTKIRMTRLPSLPFTKGDTLPSLGSRVLIERIDG